jgi:hypothetical protein
LGRYFNRSGRQSANAGWILLIGFADFVKSVNPYLRLLANPLLRLCGSTVQRQSVKAALRF